MAISVEALKCFVYPPGSGREYWTGARLSFDDPADADRLVSQGLARYSFDLVDVVLMRDAWIGARCLHAGTEARLPAREALSLARNGEAVLVPVRSR
jgi:hypothetical protein